METPPDRRGLLYWVIVCQEFLMGQRPLCGTKRPLDTRATAAAVSRAFGTMLPFASLHSVEVFHLTPQLRLPEKDDRVIYRS